MMSWSYRPLLCEWEESVADRITALPPLPGLNVPPVFPGGHGGSRSQANTIPPCGLSRRQFALQVSAGCGATSCLGTQGQRCSSRVCVFGLVEFGLQSADDPPTNLFASRAAAVAG